MRTVVFSDPKVAEQLNKQFVPLQLNLTDSGFPEELPGLAPWQSAYQREIKNHVAFATSVVLFPNGRGILGTSGGGHRWELDTSINYDPSRYLEFLAGCQSRQQRAEQALEARNWSELRNLKEEIAEQIRAANRCQSGP